VTGISWFTTELAASGWLCCMNCFQMQPTWRCSWSQHSGKRSATAPRAGSRAPARPSALCLEREYAGRIDAAFAALLAQGARALIIASGPFFVNRRRQIATLAARHAIPCIYGSATRWLTVA